MPEVTGEILKVHLRDKEGGFVQAGSVFYTINPLPYQAAVDRAVAEIKNWETQLATAQNDLKRIEDSGTRGQPTRRHQSRGPVFYNLLEWLRGEPKVEGKPAA